MIDNLILSFYKQLHIKSPVPRKIEVMNPYHDDYTFSLCEKFYRKYYHDERPRRLLLGINPGRFGSGTTGISFTDPLKLEKECGIANTFEKKPELSADFIYRMINQCGGPGAFYQHYFISAVSPLGFTMEGKNINYYDDWKLEKAVRPFIIDSIQQLLGIATDHSICFCIGEGKNFNFLDELNREHQWFGQIIPLPHPRFIMQYKRKQLQHYIDVYRSHLVPPKTVTEP